MVDVLTDLRAYADRNGLHDVAEQIQKAEELAQEEVRRAEGNRSADVVVLETHGAGARRLSVRVGAS